jgi:RNA polymerase sigma-70 factor (ECF subfamily)
VSDSQSTSLQRHLDQLRSGGASARNELLTHAYANLQRLATRMLAKFPGVRRWEDADDVNNAAMLRLWKALDEVKPATARHFYRLAAVQLRRELLDLARRYSGPQGLGATHESVAPNAEDGSRVVADPSDHSLNPARLAEWTEFHRQVDLLPDAEREVFDLLFYQDLPQAEAAQLLGVSGATLRRRWMAARLHLQDVVKNDRRSERGRS